MCDCYEDDYEELAVGAEEAGPVPQAVPLLVMKKRK